MRNVQEMIYKVQITAFNQVTTVKVDGRPRFKETLKDNAVVECVIVFWICSRLVVSELDESWRVFSPPYKRIESTALCTITSKISDRSMILYFFGVKTRRVPVNHLTSSHGSELCVCLESGTMDLKLWTFWFAHVWRVFIKICPRLNLERS